ncbi:MAG: hypothetical protein J2P36_29970 [Ktedonobacteraceae bacterium]|nr:hypothetical protein [Ktedonobacteraceae bacterium]
MLETQEEERQKEISIDMEMASLTTEAQLLIDRDQLGLPLEIYGPPTTSILTGGICALVFTVSVAGFSLYVLVWNLVRTPFSWSIIELNSGFLFGLSTLILVFFGLSIFVFRNIFRAISDRDRRVVLCTHGAAVLQGRNSESFRWQEVLTIFALSRYKARPIYTVHCHDGRKFVFQDLSGIEQLAESINVQVARANHS